MSTDSKWEVAADTVQSANDAYRPSGVSENNWVSDLFKQCSDGTFTNGMCASPDQRLP